MWVEHPEYQKILSEAWNPSPEADDFHSYITNFPGKPVRPGSLVKGWEWHVGILRFKSGYDLF